MKKNFLIYIVSLMLLTSCTTLSTNNSPTSVANQFLTALQNQHLDTIRSISKWDENAIQSIQFTENDYIENIDKNLQKKAHNALYGFTYKIKNEQIRGNIANVTISIHTKDIEKDIQSSLDKIINSMSSSIENKTNKEIQNEIITSLYNTLINIKNEKEKNVVIQLQRINNSWIVTDNNKDLEHTLLENSEIFMHILQLKK